MYSWLCPQRLPGKLICVFARLVTVARHEYNILLGPPKLAGATAVNYTAATQICLLFHATATSLNDESAGGATRMLSRHRFRTPVRLILPSPVLADHMHHDENAVDLHQRRKLDSATKYNANECKGKSATYTMPTMRTRPYIQRDEH